MEASDDGVFAERVEDLRKQGPVGRRVRVVELTDASWTKVCVFPEGARHDLINESVGEEIFPAGARYQGQRHLVVFATEAGPRLSQVPAVAISARKICYGPDAELVVFGTGPGPYSLRLVDSE